VHQRRNIYFLADKVFHPVKLQLSQVRNLVMLDEKVQFELMRPVPRLPANQRQDNNHGIIQDIRFLKLLLQITGAVDDGPDFGIIIKLLDMGGVFVSAYRRETKIS